MSLGELGKASGCADPKVKFLLYMKISAESILPCFIGLGKNVSERLLDVENLLAAGTGEFRMTMLPLCDVDLCGVYP